MIKIALDAMGGDRAPAEIVKGAVEAAREQRVEFVFVGQEEAIHQELKSNKYRPGKSRMSIVDASEVVTMDDPPISAVRQKKDSSIVVGMNLLKDGDVSALVSAGNTGAVMAAALLILGTQEGIERPALGIVLPGPSRPVLLLDVGANADCKPTLLVQFAQMGSAYMSKAFDIPVPKVGLLSIGEEDSKGNKLVREAHQLLKLSGVNFIGNVEGRDIPRGGADVVVTDGFTGNVVVKLAEGLGEVFIDLADRGATDSSYHKITSVLLKPALQAVEKRLLDYSGYGVASLLGVRGNVIVAHGRSDAKAIKRAIAVAQQVAEKGVMETLGNNEEGISWLSYLKSMMTNSRK
jgi:glycerol-3-phosphate acyltransferase PlsX